MARDPGRVLIFDTTLRDGEQSPGASLNLEEKLAIAQQLARLGVDIIEAGFPFASPGDFNAVQRIAESVGTPDGPTICGLARAAAGDIKACADAVAPAAHKRIHTFIATSDIHLEHKLRKSRAEVLAITAEMVAYARSLVDDVEFSCEDAGRSDPEFMHQVIEAAINAGATTINIPDTVGYATPAEFGALIAGINASVPNIDQAVISVHGHNDLGLAVANFLEAVKNGARQLECTINGIGERAGNASLEELVMALHVRRSYFNPFLGRPADSTEPLTGVRTEEITKTSRLVSNLTGMAVQPNKAIVGANAFAHESGIHQDGVLKNRLTYEIIDARTVGLADNRISLGKLSGRSAFRARLEELGYTLEREDLNDAFARFKELADRKREISDRDLEAIVSEQVQQQDDGSFTLKSVQVSCGTGLQPTATVTLVTADGAELTEAAIGTGPVDAVCQALNRLANVPNELVEFSVKSVTEGIDAMGDVTIRLRHQGVLYSGHSADTDIVVAAAQAFVNALNRLLAGGRHQPLHPQKAPLPALGELPLADRPRV
ncbi:2-isopropylmalate synthase [Cyanobium sp. Alchichica 3B3-8F6]|uniref:2-isopropylmalate synthase n=1 Tax=Cyanobium sp. Alchichica 3B3-8F6 TaxID=2823696 RepID=UPI0020CDF3A7|nr:2-isopropylmalate synthase [Cyanobium sp. Alchichica 3B3-8F6]MCP9882438.1 2-isopropylmalate synthase [Cyanobium sp. Alchichica 3B3-8F6]